MKIKRVDREGVNLVGWFKNESNQEENCPQAGESDEFYSLATLDSCIEAACKGDWGVSFSAI
jgi:hypothetical protein